MLSFLMSKFLILSLNSIVKWEALNDDYQWCKYDLAPLPKGKHLKHSHEMQSRGLAKKELEKQRWAFWGECFSFYFYHFKISSSTLLLAKAKKQNKTTATKPIQLNPNQIQQNKTYQNMLSGIFPVGRNCN